jgi:hypothetical protein
MPGPRARLLLFGTAKICRIIFTMRQNFPGDARAGGKQFSLYFNRLEAAATGLTVATREAGVKWPTI